jgi:NAD(P)H-quinone oxidoreductase subunit 2
MEISNILSFSTITTILPEGLLILSMIIFLILDLSFTKKIKINFIPIIVITTFASIIILLLQWINILPSESFYNFSSDSFSILFRLFILISAFICILLSQEYIDRANLELIEFISLFLTATIGSMFLCGANDLITIFVSLELLGLSSYLLSAYTKKDVRSNEAGMKYLLIGGTSSAILAYGFSWLYGLSGGEINLLNITQGLINGNITNSLAGWMTLILIIAGIGFKLAIVPFHQWTPDVYEGV